MIKKTVTWTDLNDKEQTTELYFHLSKLELGVFQQKLDGWLKKFQAAVKDENLAVVFEALAEIVRSSVGVKSEDGSRFIKTPEIQSELMSSPAVEELIYGFVIRPDEALDFISSLLPKEVQSKVTELMKDDSTLAEFVAKKAEAEDNRPLWEKENRNPTPQEFASMTPEQQKEAFARALGTK